MSEKNTGGPAFPIPDQYSAESGRYVKAVASEGMSLRDYFAAHTEVSEERARNYARTHFDCGGSVTFHDVSLARATPRYVEADAMIAAREGK